jgi:hypothetical protein
VLDSDKRGRESPGWGVVYFVYYESIKRKLKTKYIWGCRCYERLQPNTKEFTRLSYTELVLELEHKNRCCFVFIMNHLFLDSSSFFLLFVLKNFKTKWWKTFPDISSTRHPWLLIYHPNVQGPHIPFSVNGAILFCYEFTILMYKDLIIGSYSLFNKWSNFILDNYKRLFLFICRKVFFKNFLF